MKDLYCQERLLLLFLSLIFSFIVSAQYRVEANVVDEDGNPEEYATFRIFALPDTIHPVIAKITNSEGLIMADLQDSGRYNMTVVAMMKKPVSIEFGVSSENPIVNLGIITTEMPGETLAELTVTAQRPLVTKEIDRIGYDVQADGDALTSSLRDILKKVPLVTVDEDGDIKVNGSSNFNIYRNGRPNNAFSKNAKDIFAAIPASTIKKIEVITDPGAREDAESSGVILNIVTANTSSVSGITGNVGLNWQTNMGPQANAFFMTQLKKFTLSISGGYFKFFKDTSKGEQKSSTIYEDTGDTLESFAKYQAGGQGVWFNADASLELDTLNLLSTSLNGYVMKNSFDVQSEISMFKLGGERIYSYNQNSYYRKNGYTDIDFNFDYQRSTRLKGETITLSYRLSNTGQDQDLTTDYIFIEGDPFPYSQNLSDFDLKFFEHTFQLDWSRPLGNKFKLDTGAKYILRTSHSINHQNLVGLMETDDEFKHRYDIFGLYADGRANFGKFTARAGVRYEYSRLAADFLTGEQKDFHANLNDVIPNVSMAWSPNDVSMWKISYNRKIQRPGISYLNPAVSVSPTTITFGNPDLRSSTLDFFLINYSLFKTKCNVDLTLSYNMSNDGMGTLMWTDSNNITYSTFDNRMRQRNISLSTFFQWQIFEKTSWMLNGSFNWNSFKLNTGLEEVSLSRPSGYVFTRIQQQLPWDLTLSLGLNYFSGFCFDPYSYTKIPASGINYSVSLRRSFLKHKRLDISISLNNIGMPRTKNLSYMKNGGRIGTTESSHAYRQYLQIGINWRFGNLRAQVKKAEKSISNDDLQGRKNE